MKCCNIVTFIGKYNQILQQQKYIVKIVPCAPDRRGRIAKTGTGRRGMGARRRRGGSSETGEWELVVDGWELGDEGVVAERQWGGSK